MVICELACGDIARREGYAIFLDFAQRREVLSTCALNGGMRGDLTGAFNCDSSMAKSVRPQMKAPDIQEHMRIVARELGVPQSTTGMCTAAQMDNAALETRRSGSVSVTAIATGGIDENGGRAGDPASWEEKGGSIYPCCGTINIMLHIDAHLTHGALARALVTCTEAKTAAIQELMLPSRYSTGLATGSGTDNTVIVSNPCSPERLTDAGKHSKLGEMIGQAVLCVVKRALFLQTGAGAAKMHSAIARLERFGVTQAALVERCKDIPQDAFAEALSKLEASGDMPVIASLYAHLLDQLEWGLISAGEAQSGAQILLGAMGGSRSGGGLAQNYADCLANLVRKVIENDEAI